MSVLDRLLKPTPDCKRGYDGIQRPCPTRETTLSSPSHNHDHDHDHATLSEMDVRVRALETLLTQKGYIDPAGIDRIIETYETEVGPHNGAQVVAKAWAEPEFKAWLLKDATAAIASLGFTGRQGEHMVALENTPDRKSTSGM